jgi:hypothetical protein
MIARCGSTSPYHVARRCPACKSRWNAAYRASQPRKPRRRVQSYRVPNPAVCAFCGLARGNSLGVPVYRYPLQRTIYPNGVKRTAHFASIGLCDQCVIEHAEPSPNYIERAAA